MDSKAEPGARASGPQSDSAGGTPALPVGEWTLKDDNWSQNWGGATEHIKIPGHHTLCRAIKTNNSLLAIVDGPPPHGHIFWAFNPSTREVLHLSSFGQSRTGTGQGSVNAAGDVTLKLSFSDEAPAHLSDIYLQMDFRRRVRIEVHPA